MNKAEQFIDALILEIENVGTGDRLFDLLARHSSRLADVVGDAPISCCDEPWGSTVLVSHPILETTVTVPERVHKDNIERLKGEVIRACGHGFRSVPAMSSFRRWLQWAGRSKRKRRNVLGWRTIPIANGSPKRSREPTDWMLITRRSGQKTGTSAFPFFPICSHSFPSVPILSHFFPHLKKPVFTA